jgi:hypothetical protein
MLPVGQARLYEPLNVGLNISPWYSFLGCRCGDLGSQVARVHLGDHGTAWKGLVVGNDFEIGLVT